MTTPHPQRTDLYRLGDTRVDVACRPGSWFARVRVWRGRRWPTQHRVWRARMRSWIPWFSLERQAVRAVEYAHRLEDAAVVRDDIVRHVRGTLRLL